MQGMASQTVSPWYVSMRQTIPFYLGIRAKRTILISLPAIQTIHITMSPRLHVLVALAVLWVSGCASTRPASQWEPTPASQPVEQAPTRYVHPDNVNQPPQTITRTATMAMEDHLRTHVQGWLGVPYRYGGTTRNGIDCSAFVQNIFEEALGYALPRTTAQQVQVGQSIPRQALQTGDLVFFRTSSKSRHVGIYLRNGQFAHSGSSTGVTFSNLSESYWQRTYWTARRVVQPTWFFSDTMVDTVRPTTPATSEPPPPRLRKAPPRRVSGW